MLLCKQPGETGVFATATSDYINIYRLSNSALLQDDEPTDLLSAMDLNNTAVRPHLQNTTSPITVSTTNCTSHLYNNNNTASSFCGMNTIAARRRWGSPIQPSSIIPIPLLRTNTNITTTTTSITDTRTINTNTSTTTTTTTTTSAATRGMYDFGIVDPPTSGKTQTPRVPLSLSLSCGRDAPLRFFISDSTGAAWMGTHNEMETEGTFALLYTLSNSGAQRSAGESYYNHNTAIVASAWSPQSATVLAVGRRDGVVQLLDVEKSSCSYTTSPTCSLSGMSIEPTTTNAFPNTTSNNNNNNIGNTHSHSYSHYSYTSPSHMIGSTVNPQRTYSHHPVWNGNTIALDAVRERVLEGTITAIDWVPRSHTTVSAAKRTDGMGYYAEVMDMRSPESGIHYLGAPTGAVAAPHQLNGVNASLPTLCCAELVACDDSQTFVATVGSHNRRDVVQLWDLRMTSRPICCHVHSHAGYTSIAWSLRRPHTVIGTTRNGGVRVHVFTDLTRNSNSNNSGGGGGGCSGHKREEEEAEEEEEEKSERERNERETSQADDDGMSIRSTGTTTSTNTSTISFSLKKRVGTQSEERCRLHTRVPAASVAWLADSLSLARFLNGDKGNGSPRVFNGGKQSYDVGTNMNSLSRPIELGACTDLPCIILLNSKTGELYSQVFSLRGATAVMIDDVPLCSFGPNVFLYRYNKQETNLPKLERICGDTDLLSPNNNSLDSMSGHDMFDGSSEVEQSGGAHRGVGSNSRQIPGRINSNMGIDTSTTTTPITTTTTTNIHNDTKSLSCTQEGRISIIHVDRTLYSLDRLRAGFVVSSHKVLSVLLREGKDREAYVLFRYGWYVRRYLHPDKIVLPTSDVIPGMLELLQRERMGMNRSNVMSPTTAPQQAVMPLCKLILAAMGWWIDQQEEQMMLSTTIVTTPTTTTGKIMGKTTTTTIPGRDSSNDTVKFPRNCFSPTMQNSPPPQQRREKERFTSPQSWSHGSLDENMDMTFPLTPSFQYEIPISLSLALEQCDRIAMTSSNEAVERRVAILVCTGRLKEAAVLLSHYSNLHPIYPSVAVALSAAAINDSNSSNILIAALASSNVTSHNGSGCSFWMSLCLSFALEMQKNTTNTNTTTNTTSAAVSVSLVSHDTDEGEFTGNANNDNNTTNSNSNNNINDSSNYGSWISQLPLQTRREYLALFTQRFPSLPLSDRIAFATLMLLPPNLNITNEDAHLALIEVLHEMTQEQFSLGSSIGGGCSLLLSAAVEGLDRNCTSLQRYVDETGDVQTPVVYVALYGSPKCPAWICWNDAYRTQLNAEGHAILRSQHDLSCIQIREKRTDPSNAVGTGNINSNNNNNNNYNNNNNNHTGGNNNSSSTALQPTLAGCDAFDRRTVGPFVGALSGLAGGAPAVGAETKVKQKRQGKRSLELRCKCGKQVLTAQPKQGLNTTVTTTTTTLSDPVMMGRSQQVPEVCRNCVTPMCTVCGEQMFIHTCDYALDMCFTWCTVCLHGGHWSHLRDWFARHGACPAEDCPCHCCHYSFPQYPVMSTVKKCP